ncbi:MAG: SDR family NAD(P)-dependent oxidoreductase [Cyclobacteriaceae bacterium]|nr:SDR family NAD(P)-dependent oxidoreductase [Cyclobacteriaceae bacterium HetDA_MAG_MS6]
MESNNKVWFITGSSAGFGYELVKALLKRGQCVVGTARKLEKLRLLKPDYPELLEIVQLDVTNPGQVRDAIRQAVERFERIDVLVNNAGFGLQSALEEATDEQIRYQFEVNLFGALDVMRAVLPVMRKQKSGHIMNVSSVGGFSGFASFGIYNGTKFGLEGLSEALALETEHLGIKVTIIEPGAFRTDWAGRSMIKSAPIADYHENSGAIRDWINEVNGNQQGDPVLGAEAIIKAGLSENPPLRLVLGKDALDRIRQKIYSMSDELNQWEEVTVNTAFAS